MSAKLRWVVAFLLFLWMGAAVTHAQTPQIDKTIQELQSKITELQGQENTLAKQINLLNSRIALTTIRIESIRSAIAKLSGEIEELAAEIDRLEQLLTKRSELLLRRIPASYKRSVTPQFGIVLLGSNFFEFLSRVKYLASVQAQDAQLLFQIKSAQNSYNERKQLRVQKKSQQEALQKQLQQESFELTGQKREKQTLLEQTKNSESVYQRLLAQAFAEKQALERALVEGVKVGPVKKGDPIALVGNTGYPGCSTGAHLHFEVRKGGTWVDPGGYLSQKTVTDEQNGGTSAFGSGGWPWPLEDTIRITQHFGKTPYSWRYQYSGGIHTGYDMVSTASGVIRAPADGTLYSYSQTCGSGSIIKIKYIDHGDGVLSFYLHVQ